MTKNYNKLAFASVSLVAIAAAVTPASATDGYFMYGYGARQQGLGGAGVADGKDATTISLNPAGLTNVGNEASMSMTVFSPRREFNGGPAPGFTPAGKVESGNDWFYIPNMAVSYRMPRGGLFDVVGVQMYGNGGMNTDYPAVTGGAGCPFPQMGMFCGGAVGNGKAGVNLQQALLSVAFAKAIGNVSIGLAPTIARQSIEVEGIGVFGAASVAGGALSDRGTNSSYGGGLRGGVEWRVTPGIRLGVAGATPMWMGKFNEYRGLFADGGRFDIPANISAGFAVDVNPALTLMFDYKHIWYGGVGSISNPSNNIFTCFANPSFCLGGLNGPGFGWSDVDVFKVGLEYKMNPALTLRAGYSYNTAALNSRDVMFNIIAPATVQHHITGGMEYKYTPNLSFELAGAYVPRKHLSGPELNPPLGFGAGHPVDISMEQFQVTLGVKYKFGSPEPVSLK